MYNLYITVIYTYTHIHIFTNIQNIYHIYIYKIYITTMSNLYIALIYTYTHVHIFKYI